MATVGQIFIVLTICYLASGQDDGSTRGGTVSDTLSPDEVVSPKVTVQPSTTIIDLHRNEASRQLRCEASGEPELVYTWKKDGQDLGARSPPYAFDGGNLVLNNPQKDVDTGSYQCLVSNDYGAVVSIPASVRFSFVNEFPGTERNPTTATTNRGTSMQCAPPESYPGILFQWVKVGADEPAFQVTNQRWYVSKKTGDIYFATATAGDAGNYQCVVQVSTDPNAPFTDFSPQMQMIVNDAAAGDPANVAADLQLQEADQVVAVQGSSLLLEGFAYGNPIPVLAWTKTDVSGNPLPMPTKVKYERYNRFINISDVQRDDAGYYTVTATNTAGPPDSKRTLLVMAGKPVIVQGLEEQSKDRVPGDNQVFTVTWENSGDGAPTTCTWLHDGQPVVLDDRKTVQNTATSSVLTINKLQRGDKGAYQCLVNNKYGGVPTAAELRVGAPSKVPNIVPSDKGDDTLTLNWDEPKTVDPITNYNVLYYPTDNPDDRKTVDTGTDRTATLTGLTPSPDAYTYKVRAETAHVRGPYGELVGTRTGGDGGAGGGGGTGGGTAGGQTGGGSGLWYLAWLIPLLLLLLLLLLLCCCCCCWYCGLCGKYCPCCTCFGSGKSKGGTKPGFHKPMSREHQDMLQLYRTDIVDNVQHPERITAYLASTNVLPPNMVAAISRQRTREGHSKKLLNDMKLGGDEAFEDYCTALRKEEKLGWLADTLEGPGLSADKKELLLRHEDYLVNKMDPESTCMYLQKNKVFTNNMVAHCLSANTTEEKNRRILHLMQSRSDADYMVFCDSLRATSGAAVLAGLLQGHGGGNQVINMPSEKMPLLPETEVDAVDSAFQSVSLQPADSAFHGVPMAQVGTLNAKQVSATNAMMQNQSYMNTNITNVTNVSRHVTNQNVDLVQSSRPAKDNRGFSNAKGSGFGTGGVTIGEGMNGQVHYRKQQGDNNFQQNSSGTLPGNNPAVMSVMWESEDVVRLSEGMERGGQVSVEQMMSPKGFDDGEAKTTTGVPRGHPVILEVKGEVDNVKWLHNGRTMSPSADFEMTSDGSSHVLKIASMSPSKDGTYTCEGTTPEGGSLACDVIIQTFDHKKTIL
ncbi:uncharacterized protein [Branchiostoma lanceolatum]|uniref:uncharacterized protein isoform X1 n=1 Tax=Branchiostoma lanceolatum TaxID=7740 RepID=UPI003452E097